MTTESRTLINLIDITGLEFVCQECGAKFTYPLHGTGTRKEIGHCPSCDAPWFVTQRASDGPKNVQNFMRALERLAGDKDILAQLQVSITLIPSHPQP